MMTIQEKILSQIDKLSIPERILIVESIWDSILASQESITVTEQQKAELDRRLKEYENNSKNGASWTEVKKRIQSHL
jgi:putative addiction module component (TIGR02574 family)